jgi:hypothetical protein
MIQNFKNTSSTKLLLPGYLILSSFIILIPAFFNGYPLFYSDSAVYILASSLLGYLEPVEKIPYLSGIGYSFFIRIVNWQSTLYLIVIAQAIILNILIYLSLDVLFPGKKIIKYHLPIILFLSIFSSMGWTASQLMPDIFTSFLVLSVFLFYAWNKKGPGMYIFLSVVILFSVLSHLSNISISVFMIGLLVLLFLLKRSYRRDLKILIRKTILIAALLCSSLLILTGLNKMYYNYRGLSPTGHIFFMARLMDTGFMPEFLNEKCKEKSYEICKYKDNLPASYESFLWGSDNVFYKTGGWNIDKHEEYRTIIRDVLTTPKYLALFLYDCGIHSYHQLVTFKIGDGLSSDYNKQSGQYQTVIRCFNHREFSETFQASKQMQGKINFVAINQVNYLLMFISALIILWTLFARKPDRNMHLFTWIIISGVIFNAAATSSLASIFDRFQSRIIWLIPLLASVYFAKYLFPALIQLFKK